MEPVKCTQDVLAASWKLTGHGMYCLGEVQAWTDGQPCQENTGCSGSKLETDRRKHTACLLVLDHKAFGQQFDA